MIQNLVAFLEQHAHHAHWFIFVSVMLSGLNIPISTDVLLVVAALLAAAFVPENVIPLYLSIMLGSMCAAWLSYWFGRLVGHKLLEVKYFQALLPPARLEKTKIFYEKYGLLALIVGRFIPFGIRNCLFMSSGLSKLSFIKFALRDFIAVTIWSSTVFYLLFKAGQNFDTLYSSVKKFNLFIFFAFSVTVISTICYKKVRKSKLTNRSS